MGKERFAAQFAANPNLDLTREHLRYLYHFQKYLQVPLTAEKLMELARSLHLPRAYLAPLILTLDRGQGDGTLDNYK